MCVCVCADICVCEWCAHMCVCLAVERHCYCHFLREMSRCECSSYFNSVQDAELCFFMLEVHA